MTVHVGHKGQLRVSNPTNEYVVYAQYPIPELIWHAVVIDDEKITNFVIVTRNDISKLVFEKHSTPNPFDEPALQFLCNESCEPFNINLKKLDNVSPKLVSCCELTDVFLTGYPRKPRK